MMMISNDIETVATSGAEARLGSLTPSENHCLQALPKILEF